MDLEGKRLLITGAEATGDIAVAAARLAGRLGADVVTGRPEEQQGAFDGVLCAMAAGAGEEGASGVQAEMDRAGAAFLDVAYALSAAARAALELLDQDDSPRAIVGLVPERATAQPHMAGPLAALEAVGRYLACELGPRGIRVNLVAASPSREHGPAAAAACFLLSDWARAVTGETLRLRDASWTAEPRR